MGGITYRLTNEITHCGLINLYLYQISVPLDASSPALYYREGCQGRGDSSGPSEPLGLPVNKVGAHPWIAIQENCCASCPPGWMSGQSVHNRHRAQVDPILGPIFATTLDIKIVKEAQYLLNDFVHSTCINSSYDLHVIVVHNAPGRRGHAWTLQALYIDEGSESQVPIVAIKGQSRNEERNSPESMQQGPEDSSDDDRAAASNDISDLEGSGDVSCSGQRRGTGHPNSNSLALVFVSHMRGRTLGFVNPDHRAHGPNEERQTGRRSDQRREKARLRHSFRADVPDAGEPNDPAAEESPEILGFG